GRDWRGRDGGGLRQRRWLNPGPRIEGDEVRLGGGFFMSSLLTVAESEVGRLALAELAADGLDVVVGGLGLGYTARAVLEDPRVRSLTVVEALAEVIDWHERELLPLADQLTSDRRSRLVHGDFFAMAGAAGFDPEVPGRRVHAIVVDIDHSPRHVLHPGHASFYTPEGLRRVPGHLHPGGVLALWSN